MFIGDFPCIKDSVYKDDGYTGTNFNRPGFQAMLGDIDMGYVTAVMVKDLSRLGRDYVSVGNYTDSYFPERNVRFIAVNDSIDSDEGESRTNGVRQPFKRSCHNRNIAAMSSISKLIPNRLRTKPALKIRRRTGRYSKMFMNRLLTVKPLNRCRK